MLGQKRNQEPAITESSTPDLVQTCVAAGHVLLSFLEPLEAIYLCRVQSNVVSTLKQRVPWFQNCTDLGAGISAFRTVMDNLEAHTFTDCVGLCRGRCQTRANIVNAILKDALTFDCSVQDIICSPNDDGDSPALQAIMRRSHIALKVILDAGASVEIGNSKSGWSNLMHAIAKRDVHAINILLARGANANHIARPHGLTPLIVALANSLEIACLRLLDAGADAQMAEGFIRGMYCDCRHVQRMMDMLVYVVKKHSRSCPT